MAILMMGRSESACRDCSSAATGSEDGHLWTKGIEHKGGRWKQIERQGCGEKWTGIQMTYMYSTEELLDWVSGRSGVRYVNLIGVPVYDCCGKKIGTYGWALDRPLPFDVDSTS